VARYTCRNKLEQVADIVRTTCGLRETTGDALEVSQADRDADPSPEPVPMM
jgi:flagellar biosynthesis/type III secretory pathway M-ring protein FliF/YscJ